MADPLRLLVTGAGGTAAQNFIASLRLSGEPFYIVGTDSGPFHLQCTDLEQRYLVPRASDPTYLRVLNEIIRREQVALVHPQPDPEVAFLAAAKDHIEARTFLPDDATVQICQDKGVTNQKLTAAGVAVPRSIAVTSLDAVPSLLAPLAAQGAKVWVRASRGAGSKAALPVLTPRHAADWIHYWCTAKGLVPTDFMLAEYLPGKEYAWQSLWFEGELITCMARERLEYLFGSIMPSGQTSTPSIARTVHSAAVNQTAAAAVRAVSARPHGIFCVDLKENSAGAPCVTEINAGRFFTTSHFFSVAGLNMPRLYVDLALGKQLVKRPLQVNPLPANLYWVRGVDRAPRLFREDEWTATSVS